MAGCLYIVATPIGNLQDLSERAKKTLAQADVILCEDTRRTRKLISHLGLKKQVESMHEHNEAEKITRALAWLAQGKNLALASDAGTPGLSDPGAKLVAACHQAGIKVVPIPGPSALTAALSVSGLPADQFLFLGFLPAKTAQRKKMLIQYQTFPQTIVVFEAPHRIKHTVEAILEIFGERKVCLCRELTKIFEQVQLTTLTTLNQELSASQPKGEICLIIQGAVLPNKPAILEAELDALVDDMVRQGKPLKQIARQLASKTGFPKNLIYQKALQHKN